jgi:hypothetical protein|tara:strand:- start:101 stop:328 length:228 start_codon:yes stop_codon:yes gene_type:complete
LSSLEKLHRLAFLSETSETIARGAMLRAVLVFALALGVADAARPLGGSPTPAPTSPPTVLALCDCEFQAYGGYVA